MNILAEAKLFFARSLTPVPKAKLHGPRALDPELSCSLQDSANGASDRAFVVGCGCDPQLRDVAGGIVSSTPDAPRATSSGSHARHRRRPDRCGLFHGDNHCAAGPGTPADCRRSVSVDRWTAGKSAGSSGNTGSASCAILVLLGSSLIGKRLKLAVLTEVVL